MANITSKLIICCGIIVAFTNCGVFNSLKYDFALTEISGAKNTMDYGELTYVDSLIDISFAVEKSRYFILIKKFVIKHFKNYLG